MKIRLLTADDINIFWSNLQELMEYCVETSFPCHMEPQFYAEKLNGLTAYIKKGQAYVFAAFHEDVMEGFLWGYTVDTIWETRFHIAYIAVIPTARGRGVGGRLLQAAERKANELGISKIELIVSANNKSAVAFYSNQQYDAERLILTREIPRNE